MRGNTVKSFYETFDFEKAITHPTPAYRQFLDCEIGFLRSFINHGSHVLEVGCGYGRLLKIMAEKAVKATGIDFSTALLDKARVKLASLGNIELHNMDARKLCFADESFSHVVCFENTFGNMPGIELDALKEMKRVAKRGGKIILSVFSKEAREMQIEKYSSAGLTCVKDDGIAVSTAEGLYSRRFSREFLQELFAAAGLECTITRACPVSYIAVAEKK